MRRGNFGFTLSELAVVLAIIGLLLAGLLPTLSVQTDLQRQRETQTTINQVVDALLGYATAHGRLPCPAVDGATGEEAPIGGGACTSPYAGFVPGITLGLGPTDAQGYVLDAWGGRLRYAVTVANSGAFTSETGADTLRRRWGELTPENASTNTSVCNTATGISVSACASGTKLSDNAVAVILSYGKNRQLPPQQASETWNDHNGRPSGRRTFVSALPIPADATHNGFDDIVVWISPNTLYSRMIQAGRLP